MMKWNSAENPVWSNATHTSIILSVDFEHQGLVVFEAHPADIEEHGREIFSRAIAGDFGPIAEYVAPAQTPDQIAAVAKAELAAIDAMSIRSLREFITTKFSGDAALPKALVDGETKAKAERNKLK